MIAERLARQSDGFRNGFRRHAAAPLFNDRLPSSAGGHLLQDIVHQDPGSSECRLAMADGGIGDDEPPNHSRCLTVGHVEPLKHDYSPNRDKSPYSGEGANLRTEREKGTEASWVARQPPSGRRISQPAPLRRRSNFYKF